MGRPIEYTATAIRRTARVPGAVDVFDQWEDGRNVAVSDLATGRIRYNALTNRFEVSYSAGPYSPLLTSASGWTRWTYLPAGSTYAQIQAALSSADYEGVFLQDGTYNITGNLVIPDGKILSAAYWQGDPSAVSKVVLNVSSGFQIQVGKGTLQYLRVQVVNTSPVDAVTSTYAQIRFVNVRTSAGTSNQYAMSGIFADLFEIVISGMGGINVTGAPPVSNLTTRCENITINCSGSTTSGFNCLNQSNLSIRNHYISNCAGTAFSVTGGSLLLIDNIQVIPNTGTGISISGVSNSLIRGLYCSSCTGSGITLPNLTQCEVRGISVRLGSGSGTALSITGANRSLIGAVNVYSCTYSGGIIAIASNTSSYFTEISVNTGTLGIGVNCCSFSNNTDCILSGLKITNIVGSANNVRGLWASTNDNCAVEKVQVVNMQGNVGTTCYAIQLLTNKRCTFDQVTVDTCRNTVDYVISTQGNDLCKWRGLAASRCVTPLVAIFDTWINGHLSDFNLHDDTAAGINVRLSSRTQVSNIHVYNITSDAVQFTGGPNIYLRANGIQVSDCGGRGVDSTGNQNCQFTDIETINCTGQGVFSSSNTHCQFSAIRSRLCILGNIVAGTNDSYCSWSDLHLDTPGPVAGYNFFANAALATCYVDGSFEQQATGFANDNFGTLPANWVPVNVLAIP